ncbi:hypothetical protein NT01EI_2158 [Edwardsiella ictaluri 93-146]|uniref:Uncharacterized protein n=1 Tax=Edwardsiella ictaluri (strain 93-146) TaxID=634503 RepID=C5BFQ6_EDWI9|nr:hypothetical protein NT01EI_2158 [Edwardsiella ictaluri 93-146]
MAAHYLYKNDRPDGNVRSVNTLAEIMRFVPPGASPQYAGLQTAFLNK